jgi:protein-S-isoprenylcysteine O-methyltransferase Ste14
LTSPFPLLNKDLIPHHHVTQGFAVGVCLAGLFIGVWSRWTLGGNWSSAVTFKQGHELIQSGSYHWVRHPIYTGIILMCLGTALQIGQLRCWLGLPIILASFWIKLRQEESLLMLRMPERISRLPQPCQSSRALPDLILKRCISARARNETRPQPERGR